MKKYFCFSVVVHLVLLMSAIFIFVDLNKIEHIVPSYVYSYSLGQQSQNNKKVLPNLAKRNAMPVKQQEHQSTKSTHNEYPSIVEKQLENSKILKLLHDAIASRQQYPESALQLNQSGIVSISLSVYPDGRLSDIVILRSSGIGSLDTAALAAVRSIQRLPDMRLYLQETGKFSIDVVFANE